MHRFMRPSHFAARELPADFRVVGHQPARELPRRPDDVSLVVPVVRLHVHSPVLLHCLHDHPAHRARFPRRGPVRTFFSNSSLVFAVCTDLLRSAPPVRRQVSACLLWRGGRDTATSGLFFQKHAVAFAARMSTCPTHVGGRYAHDAICCVPHLLFFIFAFHLCRCEGKYGKYWALYTNQVPYRFIPGIW
jgi:hypothetical protein